MRAIAAFLLAALASGQFTKPWAPSHTADGQPDSVDSYAIKRPSGEMRASSSMNSVRRIGTGLRSPWRGSAQRSSRVFGSKLAYRRKRPSRDQLLGVLSSSDLSNRISSPEPSEFF